MIDHDLKTARFNLALLIGLVTFYPQVLRATPTFDTSEQSTACSKGTSPIMIGIHWSPRHPSVKSPRDKGKVVLSDDRSWINAHLHQANLLFAPVGVCFIAQEAGHLSDSDGIMKTRSQRTALGHGKRLKRGRIDLFIVNRLDDVDRKGEEIRGVHWRDPQARERRRWIILSRIARPKVLAHELGHYFGLPHSRYAQSIMNKRPRSHPPMSQRGFVRQEYQIMKKSWQRMIHSGHLSILK